MLNLSTLGYHPSQQASSQIRLSISLPSVPHENLPILKYSSSEFIYSGATWKAHGLCFSVICQSPALWDRGVSHSAGREPAIICISTWPLLDYRIKTSCVSLFTVVYGRNEVPPWYWWNWELTKLKGLLGLSLLYNSTSPPSRNLPWLFQRFVFSALSLFWWQEALWPITLRTDLYTIWCFPVIHLSEPYLSSQTVDIFKG